MRRPSAPLQRPMTTGSINPWSQKYPLAAPRTHDWTRQTEIGLEFYGFPTDLTTQAVWDVFSQEGRLLSIDLFNSSSGTGLNGNGRIRFNPPPSRAFWLLPQFQVQVSGKTYTITFRLLHFRQPVLHAGLNNPSQKYAEVIEVTAQSLEIGFMHGPQAMKPMFRTRPYPTIPVLIRLHLAHREMEASFPVYFQDPAGKLSRTDVYHFRVPFSQHMVVRRSGIDGKPCIESLVISLESPPSFFRKYDEGKTHQPNSRIWTSKDALFRQVDVVLAPNDRSYKALPTSLRKDRSVVNVGRWTTYRFVFDKRNVARSAYGTFCGALRDFNIPIDDCPGFKLSQEQVTAVWQFIDNPPRMQHSGVTSYIEELAAQDIAPLAFPVRYQLEVCISGGWLNEYNISKHFVERLRAMEPHQACAMLEGLAIEKDDKKDKRIYDPMSLFDQSINKDSILIRKSPDWCALIRSAVITPTTIYYNTPSLEITNRVIRHYSEYADRFLRVRFTDEKFQGAIFSTDKETMNEVFTRIKRTMTNGITIGDRRYDFLAFGNSQFREHGAYFFCGTHHLTAARIRSWMGNFNEIRVVAKYAARLGQCFSTTRPVKGATPTVTEIPDILRGLGGKYNFTDGVGKISGLLACIAAENFDIPLQNGEPPSVFQFRCGGSKGVLAVWPELKGRQVHLRPSQYKFDSTKEELEIIRWSQFAAASLNRQLIIVLSALGVPDSVFMDKLKSQLSDLDNAMTNEGLAKRLLLRTVDHNQMTPVLAGMIEDGFQAANEPFMRSLVQLWRTWSIKYLKEKAKIVIPLGGILLGCTDETATLKGHFDRVQPCSRNLTYEERRSALPEIFLQLSNYEHTGKSRVITGLMALARNPSLHPGDIRVVRGVDVPALHHLKDVVVLPQTGDRDLAGMCSGGDLDGDDYVVIWDEDLIPCEWTHEPMDYTAPSPDVKTDPVTIDDISSFFVRYMKNDTLGTIATAHLAMADHEPQGVKNYKCLQLAALHSNAVDYAKSGKPAVMTRELRPSKHPHFMERKKATPENTYKSRKVLGRMYDYVQRVDFVPDFDSPFDKRILDAFDHSPKDLADAAEIKVEYDAAVRRIMAQHDIRSEFEIWSTFVLHHANHSKDFKFHEEMGRVSLSLKQQFRQICEDKVGGRGFDRLAPFVAAMYQVTSNEMATALDVVAGKEEPMSMPLMSFPWIFHTILGRIAITNLRPRASMSSNIGSLQEETDHRLHSFSVAAADRRSSTSTSWEDLAGLDLLGPFSKIDEASSSSSKIAESPAKFRQETAMPSRSDDTAGALLQISSDSYGLLHDPKHCAGRSGVTPSFQQDQVQETQSEPDAGDRSLWVLVNTGANPLLSDSESMNFDTSAEPSSPEAVSTTTPIEEDEDEGEEVFLPYNGQPSALERLVQLYAS